MPDALHEESPLQAEGSQEQVDADAAEPVSLQEGHQEPEADEDHDVDILKHCRRDRREVSDGGSAADLTTRPCFVVSIPLSPSAKCGHEIESDETL